MFGDSPFSNLPFSSHEAVDDLNIPIYVNILEMHMTFTDTRTLIRFNPVIHPISGFSFECYISKPTITVCSK